MQNWLWIDPEHVFWMRVVIALAPGFWVCLAGVAGVLFFRWRERARLQELTMADLRKLRFDTVLEVLNAWTAHFRDATEARSLRGVLKIAEVPADQLRLQGMVADAEAREQRSLTVFTDLVMAKGLFLPDSIATAYLRYIGAPENTRQRQRALDEVAASFQAFLPALPEKWRPFWKLRFWIATKAGADDDEVAPPPP